METDETEAAIEGIVWNKPYFYLNGKVFTPHIYETQSVQDQVPAHYNTVSIPLDGKLSSDLDWKKEEEAAERYIGLGYKLFWKLDLGLFNTLKFPLSNPSQFLSLVLSLEHFRDGLWKKFKEHTLGVSIYDGPADFTSQLAWDEQLQGNYLAWGQKLDSKFEAKNSYFKSLFARDAAAEYLILIGNRMPDAMPLFLDLTMQKDTSVLLELQLLHRERFDRFHLICRNSRFPSFFVCQQTPVGVCLPSYQIVDPALYNHLENAVNDLLLQKISFRLIPEAYLINEWDGLDDLIVNSAALSQQGIRKLHGFCAAGGRVLSLGKQLGLPNEKFCTSSINLLSL